MAAKNVPGTVEGTFELTDDQLETLKSTRGRKATPSIYEPQVRASIDNKDPERVYGIYLTNTVKAAQVQAQLRKAAKEFGYEKEITVFNREESKTKDAPHGFVAWKMAVKSETEPTESTDATD